MADEVVDIQPIYVLNHLKSNLKLLLYSIESKELNILNRIMRPRMNFI